MKVSIYKLPEGRIDAMVEAAVGHGKAPVVLQRLSKATLIERLPAVLDAQRGRRVREPVPE